MFTNARQKVYSFADQIIEGAKTSGASSQYLSLGQRAAAETKDAMQEASQGITRVAGGIDKSVAQGYNPYANIAAMVAGVNEADAERINQEPITGPDTTKEIKTFKNKGILFGGYGDLISLIDQEEGAGNYDTLFAHSQKEGKPFEGIKVSQMTIGELLNFANNDYGTWSKTATDDGRKATPMGRYQFVGDTLKETAEKMGLPLDTVFSPEVQDQMFAWKARKVLNSGGIPQLKKIWVGLAKIPNDILTSAVEEFKNSTSVMPKPRPFIDRP